MHRFAFALLCALICLSASTAAQVGGEEILHHQFQGVGSNDQLGFAVDNAGDVNADGYSDVVISVKSDPAVIVYSGFDGSVLLGFGLAHGIRAGYHGVGAGDVNGDGFADILVGYRFEDAGGLSQAGVALVFSGADGSQLYRFEGAHLADYLGGSLAGAGDVNADGYDDFLIGAPGYDTGLSVYGAVYVHSGVDGSLLHLLLGHGSIGHPMPAFAESIDGAGDVNNDGHADIIVGAPDELSVGTATVYSGATGAEIAQYLGWGATSSMFGYSVSGAGDVNNDGYAEVIVGAPLHSPGDGRKFAGAARVYSGATNSLLYSYSGPFEGFGLGVAVSGAGDVNDDGFDDILFVGHSTDHTGRQILGSAYLHSGVNGAILHRFEDGLENTHFGYAVSDAGDVNNDGLDDIIIGAPWHNQAAAWSGTALVYGFHPFLSVDGYTVSALGGGVIQLDLDFPSSAANFDYKLLISMSGTGRMVYGSNIPLEEDVLVHHSFHGNYPFATYSNLHGSLDSAGDASASISIAPSELSTSLIGRTFHMAVVASFNNPMAADFSSIAIPIEIMP